MKSLSKKVIMMDLLKGLKAMYRVTLRNAHCGNAGKNEAFKRLCKLEGKVVNFEYTTLCTLQQNGQVEGSCPYLIGCMLCQMVGSFIFFQEVYVLRQLILPCYWKII